MSYLGGSWKQMERDKCRWIIVLLPFLMAAIALSMRFFIPLFVGTYAIAWIGFAEKYRERERAGEAKKG